MRFGVRLAYTFDAGPNCCLFMDKQTVPLLRVLFKQCFQFNYVVLPEFEGMNSLNLNLTFRLGHIRKFLKGEMVFYIIESGSIQ